VSGQSVDVRIDAHPEHGTRQRRHLVEGDVAEVLERADVLLDAGPDPDRWPSRSSFEIVIASVSSSTSGSTFGSTMYVMSSWPRSCRWA
jgi:hypothetical protein